MGRPPLSDAARRRQQTVLLAANGEGRKAIARRLKVSKSLVDGVLARPDIQEDLARARARVKARIMGRAEKLVDGTLDVVGKAITDEDAKSLELSTRAALNLEKLTQSASGETQKVEVQGHVNVDVRAILAKLAQG